MKFVNLTPWTINELISGQVFPPSGQIARTQTRCSRGAPLSGVPIHRAKFLEPVGLPDPVLGVTYIVFKIVALASGREDIVFAAAEPERCDSGEPVDSWGLYRVS